MTQLSRAALREKRPSYPQRTSLSAANDCTAIIESLERIKRVQFRNYLI